MACKISLDGKHMFSNLDGGICIYKGCGYKRKSDKGKETQ